MSDRSRACLKCVRGFNRPREGLCGRCREGGWRSKHEWKSGVTKRYVEARKQDKDSHETQNG